MKRSATANTRSSPAPRDNQILAALPADEAARLFPQLTLVEFPLGMSVYESGDLQRYIYFPTDSIVSLLYVLKERRVGRDRRGR